MRTDNSLLGLRERIIEIARRRYDDLAPAKVERAKSLMLDTLAAIGHTGDRPELVALRRFAPTEGQATIVAKLSSMSTPSWAAFLNGTAAVWSELDPGHWGSGHPSAHVLPAALAVAEDQGSVSGKELLEAFVAGYETHTAIAQVASLLPSIHPHGALGAVGAAVATSKVMKLDAAKIATAVDIAATFGFPGLFAASTEGCSIRNSYVGQAAQIGVLAGQMASAGFTAPEQALQHTFGSVLGRPRTGGQAGQHDLMSRSYVKRWGACGFTHSSLDALMQLLEHRLFEVSNIDRIEIEVPAPCMSVAELHDQSPLAARFSIPMSVATLVLYGNATTAFDQSWCDPSVRELAGRVGVRAATDLTEAWSGLCRMGARVKAFLSDGDIQESTVHEVWQPMGQAALDEFIRGKVAALAPSTWNSSELITAVMSLDQIDDVRALTRSLR